MSEGGSDFTPDSARTASRKKPRRSRSNSSYRNYLKEAAVIEQRQQDTGFERNRMDEELIQAPPLPIMYYCR